MKKTTFGTILRSRAVFIYLIFLGSIFLFSLWHRQADIDDAWIGEHAYWLAHDGHARSELMRGITGQEDYLIVDHKLLTLHGALFIKLFGFSIFSLKAVSLLYFMVFLFLFYRYAFIRKKIPEKHQAAFVLILMLSFAWVFKYAFVFRPEMMIMTLTFAMWMLLESVLENKFHSYWLALAAGILAGLGFAAHLNGIVTAGAGFLLLVINKRLKPALIFGLGALAGMAVYFYDFNASHGWQLWWYQFSESPALDSVPNMSPWLKPLYNLMNEHQRFYHNPMIAFFSVFATFTLILGLRFLAVRRRNMMVFTLLLALLLGLTAMHKSRQYLLLYFPFVAIMVSDVYFALFSDSGATQLGKYQYKKIIRYSLMVLLMVYLVSGLYHNMMYSLDKFTAASNSALARKYIHEDYSRMNVVAPLTFIFNEIENFNRIQGDVCYTEMQKSDPSIYGAGFLERTKSFNIRYIILSEYTRNLLGWKDPQAVELPAGFEIISDPGDEYLVFRRIGDME